MKRIVQVIALFALGLLIGSVSAQQPKPAPVVPDGLQARFWKAQAAVQADRSAVQAANDSFARDQGQLQAVVKELTDLCGKDFEPQMSPKGDPACVAKPVPSTKKP